MIVKIKLANRQDVEAAYAAAKSAQRGWADRLPDERAQMMYRAAAIVEERRERLPRGWCANPEAHASRPISRSHQCV
jgi:acyl-CoA reductase-like NAD-dependent aldehyde dehydrogenase